MQVLIPTHLTTGSTLGGQTIATLIDIPTTLPANGGDADTVDGKNAADFAPISHVGAGGTAHALATTGAAGFMSGPDKSKVDNITAQATKTEISGTNGNILINGIQTVVYTHPTNHLPSVITQDTNNRFVTDIQITAWNAKQAALGFTPENVTKKGVANGYASLDASTKIPEAQMPVNVFVPIAHAGAGGSEHALATTLVAGFFDPAEKIKLGNISPLANKTGQSATNGNVLVDGAQIVVYAHPSTHPATMITEDTSHKFVTDAQITSWNAKQSALGFTPENVAKKGAVSGYASLDATGKIPLTQLPDTARQQTYIVINTTEMNALTGLISGDRAFQTSTNDTYIYNGATWILMADADWANIELSWGNISGTPTSAVSLIDDAVNKRHTHTNKAILDAVTASYTTTEETKLAGVATNANNYVHPSTHPATMITEDTSHKFVTDAQIATWNAKQAALGFTPLNPASNLFEVTNVATARANLGLTGNSNTTHYHDSQYYTKTQLNTSGQGAAVHWANITNPPTSMPANGGNADTVDGLSSEQFLRSDTDDVMTGTLTTFAVVTTRESRMALTTFVDPRVGVGAALKVSQGIATDVMYAKDKVTINRFSMEWNATESSLDFVFN